MVRLLFILLPFWLIANPTIQLKDRLRDAKKGDFVVTHQNKNLTLWHIKDKSGDVVLIEEVGISQKRINLREQTWEMWLQRGAPFHTGWVMYTIDIPTGRMLSLYNVDLQQFVPPAGYDRFMSTLLNVPFFQIPYHQRKKVGGKPTPFNQTGITIWSPPLVFQGKRVPGIQFEQYCTQWPKDGSDLSGRSIEIYLTEGEHPYPSYFPYWLQVSSALGDANLRIVDTGIGLQTSTPSMWK